MLKELLGQLARLVTWVLMVSPWEQALRVRSGKHVRLLRAGLHLRIPFVDRVYRQSVRRRICTIAPQTITTSDGYAVTVGAALGYSIVDLLRLYETLHDAQDTIEAEIAAIMAGFIASHLRSECLPLAIEQYVMTQAHLQNYGLSAAEFSILSFATVKTYRFITGNFREWQSDPLNTVRRDEASSSEPVGMFVA
jgi:regulator of protease activity HflC (stomatin/prohibitin superfamily)